MPLVLNTMPGVELAEAPKVFKAATEAAGRCFSGACGSSTISPKKAAHVPVTRAKYPPLNVQTDFDTARPLFARRCAFEQTKTDLLKVRYRAVHFGKGVGVRVHDKSLPW
jgi:hypothetical protein